MTDRPKAKVAHGERNSERRNGKAFKKNPKSPARAKSEATTWGARKEARRKARAKSNVRARWEAKQARAMDHAQRKAIEEENTRSRLNRQTEAAKKHKKEAAANARMVEAMRNGKAPE
jgi:hypothetical protein